jgi:hypothetical protein
VFCCYRCANFAGGVLPDRAALAADWVANLAMSSRRRNFCFLNLLNLALSPFCDDICRRSSNVFVTQRAEDKSDRSSMRQATDGRCEAQGTLRRNPLQRLRVRLLGLLPADKISCGMPAGYSIFRKTCHVVADSETWPNAAAVARFPRNGVSGKFGSSLAAPHEVCPKSDFAGAQERSRDDRINGRRRSPSVLYAANREGDFGLLFHLCVVGLACFFTWLIIRHLLRRRQIRQYARSAGFIYLGTALPKSLQLGLTSLNGADLSNAFAGERRGEEFVFFDSKIGTGKGSYYQSAVAIRGPRQAYGPERFDISLTTERAGDWLLIYRPKQLLPIGEIQALLSGI